MAVVMSENEVTRNPWKPELWNGLAYGLWLGIAGWIGVTSDSWKNGLEFVGFGIGVVLFWGILLASVLGIRATSRTARLLARITLSIYILGFIVFAYGMWERFNFMRNGEPPAWAVTHDYGNTFPPGEVDRLRKTDCKDYGPLEIAQTSKRWVLRCGRFIWNSHTYVTTADPLGAEDPDGVARAKAAASMKKEGQ
jgi:hypothetical protein